MVKIRKVFTPIFGGKVWAETTSGCSEFFITGCDGLIWTPILLFYSLSFFIVIYSLFVAVKKFSLSNELFLLVDDLLPSLGDTARLDWQLTKSVQPKILSSFWVSSFLVADFIVSPGGIHQKLWQTRIKLYFISK